MTKDTLPWEHPGWLGQATSWIEARLAQMNTFLLEAPEPVRQWALSSVLRVRTTSGTMFFKASARPPLFADEASLLTYLAVHNPGTVPVVVATHADTGWILTRDAGAALHEPVTPEQKSAILGAMVDLQQRLLPDIDTLLSRGVLEDRRPERLVSQIEPTIQDDLVGAYLSDSERAELAASAPSIVGMCAELPEYAVPPTLVHGDLHARNALMNGHDLVLIDWSEACVTHPFMDAFMIYNEQDVSVRDRMRDSYLSRWATFESFDRLLELWSLCGVVHAMHHAVSYRSILRHTPEHARGDLANTLPFLLRKALGYLHEPA